MRDHEVFEILIYFQKNKYVGTLIYASNEEVEQRKMIE